MLEIAIEISEIINVLLKLTDFCNIIVTSFVSTIYEHKVINQNLLAVLFKFRYQAMLTHNMMMYSI